MSPMGNAVPMEMDERAVKKKLKYPKSVFFIICNEFCERFSFYGMRTILVLFLSDVLHLTENGSTVVYHVFVMFCYFFPLIGAIMADSWLGKFKTILYLSIVYAIGNVVISVASATNLGLPSTELAYVGLLLIALGTGGIKPCVSAFGGDQFRMPQQERQLTTFFSVFYFAINAGSLISTYLTPELRKDIKCLDQDSCYPLAFGVPAILMIVSLVIFVCGKPMYIINKPQGNTLVLVFKCMSSAIRNKWKRKIAAHDHWLEYADSTYDEKLRSDIRSVLRVLLLFVPLPIFWALFDQQGSRWTFQATNMNGQLGSWNLKPDQMQVVNPLLILLFLPMCETILYPALNKCNMLTRPLQKMVTGGLLAALAFFVSGFLELQIESSYAVVPSEGLAQLRVFNGIPCDVDLKGDMFDNGKFVLKSLQTWTDLNIKAKDSVEFNISVEGSCASSDSITLTAYEKKSTSYHLYSKGRTATILSPYVGDKVTKNSNPYLRVLYRFNDTADHTLELKGLPAVIIKSSGSLELNGKGGAGKEEPIVQDRYSVFLDGNQILEHDFGNGGVYTLLLDENRAYVETLVQPNSVHMLWLLPQYIIMTLGEVMFSVTGLEFAFTQAPDSMKSVLTSAWLLTVAFGNLLDAVIAGAAIFASHASEFFLFAGLMVVDMGIFILLAMKYKYVTLESENSENDVHLQTSPHVEANGGSVNK